VYAFARRNQKLPLLELFDRPDAQSSCACRHETTSPTQALALLNSEWAVSMAEATAARAMKERKGDETAVHAAFRLVVGRAPSAKEREVSIKAEAQLVDYCRALLNSNAFLWLD
jgi:hypothetical protein